MLVGMLPMLHDTGLRANELALTHERMIQLVREAHVAARHSVRSTGW